MSRELEAREAERKRAAAGTAVPHVDMGHTPVVADFVDAITTGRDPFVTSSEARKAVALVTAVYESSRRGGVPIRSF